MRQSSNNYNSNLYYNINKFLYSNYEKNIEFPVSFIDSSGILKLNIRNLNLEFRDKNGTTEKTIECLKRENNAIIKNIKIIQQYNMTDNNDDYKYLLYIRLIKDDQYVFRFREEKDRDFLLNRINFLYNTYHFYIYAFQHLTNLDKKKIKLIIENDYLSILFNELVCLNDIFDIDNFIKFIKKKYPNYIKFSIIENNIQISRDDEVNFKKKYNQILNKEKINKLISSNSNLKILYNKFKKNEKINVSDYQKNNNNNNNILNNYLKNSNEEEKNFWEKFLKNNWTQDTEIFGGLKEIDLTSIEKEFNNKEIKYNKKNKEPTLNEKIELNNNFIIPFENNFRENFKEKILKNEYEIDEYEKTNCNLFINNLNDYCMRKIKNSEFIPEINNLSYNNNNIRNKNNNKNINLNINKKKINNKIEKNNNILNILNQMKMEKKENFNYKKTYENINKKYINNLKKLKSIEMNENKNYIIRFCQLYKDINSIKNIYDFNSRENKNLFEKSKLCNNILNKYSKFLSNYFNNLNNDDVNNINNIPYFSLLSLIENTIPKNLNLNKKK